MTELFVLCGFWYLIVTAVFVYVEGWGWWSLVWPAVLVVVVCWVCGRWIDDLLNKVFDRE